MSGTIGFVGLIVPHAVRLMWGPDNRQLLPMSIVLGAAFLIGADLVARTIDEPPEIPVGIITAFCGVPFFLYPAAAGEGRTRHGVAMPRSETRCTRVSAGVALDASMD